MTDYPDYGAPVPESLPLPSGAATAAKQDSILSAINALPIPGTLATAALQQTMITALQKIDDLQNALNSINTDKLLAKIYSGGEAIPVGKIPDGGTQIAKSGIANNNTVIVHTVTAGKTFYLTAMSISISAAAAGVPDVGYFNVRDDGDVSQCDLCRARLEVAGSTSFGLAFPCPLELPAGYDVTVVSPNSSLRCYGLVCGYEL